MKRRVGFVLLIICVLPASVLASQHTHSLGQSRGTSSIRSFSHHSHPSGLQASPFHGSQPHSGLKFHKEGVIGPHDKHPHVQHKRFKRGFFPFFYQPYTFRDRSYDDAVPPALESEEDAALEERTLPPVEKPAPLPHPLIIEERCGRFVSIPWPESGSLDEGSTTQPCPD